MVSTKIIVVVLSALARSIHASVERSYQHNALQNIRTRNVRQKFTRNNTTRQIDNLTTSLSPTHSPTATYILPSPECIVDVSDLTSDGDVTCAFSGIISPNSASLSMQILSYNCESAYEATLFGNTAVTADTPQVTGVSFYNSVASVDPTSGHEGDVKFCIRTDLKDSSGITRAYRLRNIVVTFIYTLSFSVNISPLVFNGIDNIVRTGAKSFEVTSVVCDSTGAPIINPPNLSLGQHLFICIETNAAKIKIPSITSFTVTKDDIQHNIAASANVIVRGLNTSKLKVAVHLPAMFFDDTTEILVSGNVVVTQDDGSSSHRALTSNPWALEEDTSNTMDAKFGVPINVNQYKSPVVRYTMPMTYSVSGYVLLCTVIFGVGYQVARYTRYLVK